MHSNLLFSRAPIPHAKRSPNRKNPDENHSISTRVDLNHDLDREKQDMVKSSAHISHDSDVDTEDTSFHWEDQDSFLNDLQEKSLEGKDNRHRLEVAVESIQPTFVEKAESLNIEFAQLMVPVSNRVRSTFQQLELNADTPMIKGLHAYEHAVRGLTRISPDERREVEGAYLSTKEKMSTLLQELEEEYQTRDKLWFHYEQALDEQGIFTNVPLLYSTTSSFLLVNAMKDLLREAPGRMEKTIARLEKKQAKELENNQPDGLNMNRLLAQLLGNH